MDKTKKEVKWTATGKEVQVREMRNAFKAGDVDELKALIKAGADVNAKDEVYGETLLYSAVLKNEIEMVEVLIEAGAEVNDGKSLHTAVHFGRREIVKILIAAGADVNVKTGSGWTALHMAAHISNAKIVNALLESGADINTSDTEERTPLHLAVAEGHIKTIKALLRAGANVNAKTKDGWTSLHCAAYASVADVMSLLIEAGADVNAETKKGKRPLDFEPLEDAKELLKKHGADYSDEKKRELQDQKKAEQKRDRKFNALRKLVEGHTIVRLERIKECSGFLLYLDDGSKASIEDSNDYQTHFTLIAADGKGKTKFIS